MIRNRIADGFRDELKAIGWYDRIRCLKAFVGDIHNHCGISYGHGSDEKAIRFASLQLDFFSVTGHFAWPDMDDADKLIPDEVKAYHREGFRRLRDNWASFQKHMEEAGTECLIPFLSYEYHSFLYGDYTVLCKYLDEELPPPVPEGKKDSRLEELLEQETSCQSRLLPFPHHIGYKQGHRGINWTLFSEKASPIVEIASMHGAAESTESRLKYLHTMGPRSCSNTYQGGLVLGHHFGVTGSTDHHNASPGSYGFGRTVLWADDLSRDSIWSGLVGRFTSAVTGDPMQAILLLNDSRMGEITNPSSHHRMNAFVASYDALEKVEIIKGDKVIEGRYDFSSGLQRGRGFISCMFGWGEKHKPCKWDVKICLRNGRLLDAIPRLRGVDIVDPLDKPDESADGMSFSFSDGILHMRFRTDGNPTAVTDTSQGCVIELELGDNTFLDIHIEAIWNGCHVSRSYSFSADDMARYQNTEYISGFVSPAIEIGQFRPAADCLCSISSEIEMDIDDSIYLRAYEKNGDAVFTSPITMRN